MSHQLRKWLHCTLCVLLFQTLIACDKISIPRLSWEREAVSKVPVAVVYRFDPTLAQHTQVVDACGFPYTINSGEIITKTFLQVGQESFASVRALPATGTSSAAIPANALMIDLKFVQFDFEPVARSGEEDRYHANVGLQLQAVYQDPEGNALAQTPLSYSDKANMWTPALSGQSNSCATGQFDAVVENAAETLALDMVSVIPQLYGQVPKQPSQPGGDYAAQIPAQSIPVQQPSISFRTMLQDENDNLVLEGGEKLVLQIEMTNTTSESLPSSYVELRGSQAIVNAFAQVTALPISVGAFQPGEKKTTEVRGRMPANVDSEKGELVVSVSLSQGIPPGPHKILAAIQPGKSSRQPAMTQQDKPSPSKENRTNPSKAPSSGSPYYAIVVGLDSYRDPWPQAHHIPKQQIQALADVLRTTGTFPPDHIKVLNGNRATRADIEEALFSMAKRQLHSDAIVMFYFAGHALVDASKGEVYLVPYEGSPSASKKRLISLRSLQRVLHKLRAKLSILFLDTPVTHYLREGNEAAGLNGSSPANWQAFLPRIDTAGPSPVVQVRRLEGKIQQDPAQLLSGLLGRADRNHNGTITVGELLEDLRGTAEIIPSQSSTNPHARIPLAH